MDAAARNSLIWGIVLLALGALVSAFGSDIHLELAGSLGLQSAGFVLRMISTLAYVATPLGAALVGAAVVIRALSPARRSATPSRVE